MTVKNFFADFDFRRQMRSDFSVAVSTTPNENKIKIMRRILFFFITALIFETSYSQEGKPKDYPSGQLQDKQTVRLKGSIYLQFNTSALFSSLTAWKNQLHMPDGTHPSSNFMIFGGEGGYIINRYIQAGIGYEFLFTSKVSTIETSGDQITSTFFYGSLKVVLILNHFQSFICLAVSMSVPSLLLKPWKIIFCITMKEPEELSLIV